MIKQLTKIFQHSLFMMKIHWQAYLSLSLTIIISLSLFLGILFYYDTTYFNRFQSALSSPPNFIQSIVTDSKSAEVIKTLAKKYDVAFTFSWKRGEVSMQSYLLPITLSAQAYFVDQNFFDYPIYFNGDFNNHSIIKGRSFTQEEVSSKKRVLLIEEKFSNVLFGHENPIGQEIRLPSDFTTGTVPGLIDIYTVIGVVKSVDFYPSTILNENNLVQGNIYLPLNELDGFKGLTVYEDTLFVADSEEVATEVYNAIRMEGLSVISSSFLRQYAINNYVEMRESQIPLLSSVLIILSLNLFALHSNVLKKRNQEIAIKRSLGASKESILLEFFIEGLIVFVLNFLIVNFLIATAGIVWYYFNHFKYPDFIQTLMITPHSIKLYLLVSITLTILNSLILSYQATRIVIIDAIKSE